MQDEATLFDLKTRAPRAQTPEPMVPDASARRPAFDVARIQGYLRMIYRRRWPAAAVLIVTFATFAIDAMLAPPLYEARVRLLIEPAKPNIVNFQDVVDEGQARADYYETQYNLLRSRSLARRTIQSLGLWARPPFGGGGGGRDLSLSGLASRSVHGMTGWVRAKLRVQSGAEEPPPATETAAQSRAIDVLLAGLTVTPLRNSRIFDLTYTSGDPTLAMRVANEHAKGFIEQSMEFRFMASKDATDWLSARMTEARAKVAAAEEALQRYRENNAVLPVDEKDHTQVQQLADLSAAVTRAHTERIEKEAVYNELVSVQNNQSALEMFPAVLKNDFIQQQKTELATLQRQEAALADKLGDKHPDMVRLRASIKSTQLKIQAEVGRVAQSVRNEYKAAQAQERSLTDALDHQKRASLAMNQKAMEYGVLQREVESTRQIYETLLQRAKETGVSSELRTSAVRVVDPAERPRGPVGAGRRSSLTRAFGWSLLLAIAVALTLERLDNRIKHPEEVRAHLQLPLLGMLPIAAGSRNGTLLITNSGVPTEFVESVRTMRTNVLFSSAEEGPRTVVVTSTEPTEGKTTVATNLAVALAQSDRRILLIDADMRRPGVHQRFGLKPQPGLSQLLVGTAKANDVVTPVPGVPQLWALPAGHLPPNPSELLGSRRFKAVLQGLREHFDWILIDTPPLLAVTDASVVAHGSSGVVVVVGAEMTTRQSVGAALEQLETVKARVLGAVLNRVDLAHQPYYYAKYYRRRYAQYYRAS